MCEPVGAAENRLRLSAIRKKEKTDAEGTEDAEFAEKRRGMVTQSSQREEHRGHGERQRRVKECSPQRTRRAHSKAKNCTEGTEKRKTEEGNGQNHVRVQRSLRCATAKCAVAPVGMTNLRMVGKRRGTPVGMTARGMGWVRLTPEGVSYRWDLEAGDTGRGIHREKRTRGMGIG